MKALSHISCTGLLLGTLSCTSLTYPSFTDDRSATPAAASTEPIGPPSAPVLLEIGFAVPEEEEEEIAEDIADNTAGNTTGNTTDSTDSEDGSAPEDSSMSWSELTRRARDARARGRLEEVQRLLAQAAAQLASRAPTNAQRRAVFGLRARLALDFGGLKRFDESDALAETLFDEAKNSPALGGMALADLAHLVAARRAAEAVESGDPASPLPLLRVALAAAENESASKLRLNRAFEVSKAAMAEDDYSLARRAIDRAVLDAQILEPANKNQLASLEIYKARIALAQGDLPAAEASAIAANRIFEEIDASSPNRAVAESEMARIVAATGDEERARAILAAAQARMDGDPPLPVFARRVVLGATARIERSFGKAETARDLYRQAIALPPIDFSADRSLIIDLTEELASLESPEIAP